MSEPKLIANMYGNVDVRSGVPEGAVHVERLPANVDDLRVAGIKFFEALVKFIEAKRGWKPVLQGWVIDADWASKLEAKADVVAASKAERERQAAEDRELKTTMPAQKRSQAGKKAAATRRERTFLSTTAYGRLLMALRNAQQASDRAKDRPANGVPLKAYRDGSKYSRSNYHRSREARTNDYTEKSKAIDNACAEAAFAGIEYGWKRKESMVPFVCYFDLPTGQVSFHCESRGKGPKYMGNWDGKRNKSTERIEAAIKVIIADTEHKANPKQSDQTCHR